MVSTAAMLLLRWNVELTRSARETPLLPPLFVAEQGLGVTVGYLAKGLPIFEVIFARYGSFEVRGNSE